MIELHVNRDVYIADLEIHGWSPVRDALQDHRSFTGIWHAGFQIGFAWSRSIAGSRVIRLDGGHPDMVPVPCEWSDISDQVLNALEGRLAEV